MRNAETARLDVLTGRWRLTLSDAWFLEPAGRTVAGEATVEWIGDSFVAVHIVLDGDEGRQCQRLVLGRSDPRDAFVALYHDDRGVGRLYGMTFDGASWVLDRKDADMHQRFLAEVGPERISGRWEASEDDGATWRKDYALTFDRL